MEPTNFDDFIKSNSKHDLPVPTELNWDNMNFSLPQAKRKRRILSWILCCLIGALGIGSGLWYAYQRNTTQSQSLSKNEPIGIQNQNNKIILKKGDASVDTAHPQDAGKNTLASNSVTNQENLKTRQLAKPDMANTQDAGENAVTPNNITNQATSKTQRPAKAEMPNTQDAGENTAIPNKVSNQATSKTQRPAKTELPNTQDAGENTVTRNNLTNQENFKAKRSAKIKTGEGKPLSSGKAAKSNDIEYAKAATLHQTEPAQLDGTEKTNQTSLKLLKPNALRNVLPVEPIRSTSSEKQLTVSPQAKVDPNTKKVTKPITLLVSIGMNKAQMNHNSARLNGAVTPAWGNSFQMLLERELKNNWLFSVGLGYQRLHTTFYFEKDLGRFVNASQLEVIKRTRYVFHNNYVDLVSLNLGGGKQFKLSPRWHGQLLMYLSPTRRLSYTGKFLDGADSIVAFDPNAAAQKKWLFNADAAFRVSYKLKKTDFIIGFNLSQSLTKSGLQSVGNSTTTVQPRVFGLSLGIKRSLGIMRKK